jgi:hypothetical protein
VKVWPVSHLGQNWVYGHGRGLFTQEDIDDPNMFSFSFTYLPRTLIQGMIDAGAEDWYYPVVDLSTWELAKRLGVKVRVARDCQPKHMHW